MKRKKGNPLAGNRDTRKPFRTKQFVSGGQDVRAAKTSICDHCATELRATFVHRMGKHGLTSQPGYECPRCLALYDMNGTELSAPLTNRTNTDGQS